MYTYLIMYAIAWIIGVLSVVVFCYRFANGDYFKKLVEHRHLTLPIFILFVAILFGVYSFKTYPPSFAMPPWMHSFAPGGKNPDLPIINIFKFFLSEKEFERVEDIGRDPNEIPKPLTNVTPQTVEIKMTTKEVLSEIAPNIYFNYWTYDGKVPGPFLRVRVGDTVLLSLTNDKTSLHPHNIDLHAVTGPGGGAVLTNVNPGETKTFKWKALNPGLYVYHCATMNVSTHNAHGQYGLILVEPEGGLPKVDKEFYLMQGELYTEGGIGRQGLTVFDSKALIDGNPSYVTFNGRVEYKTKMEVDRGDKVRMYVGNGGLNLISSFHVIGEIFDTVYPEGAMGNGSPIFRNVQTTIIPAGGSAIVEFTVEVPGKLTIVDHALARMNKGAWASMDVKGEANGEVFSQVGTTTSASTPSMHGDMKGMDMKGGY